MDEINSFPIKDAQYKGMMSIGFRPTVDGKKRVIEVNVFDFIRDIWKNNAGLCKKVFKSRSEI
jgi:FAD synthase